MDNEIIFTSSTSGSAIGANFIALSPFSAMANQELAKLFAPASFPEVESNSSGAGLRWAATGVVVHGSHGTYKLYLCQRKGLAMWVPSGDWFYTNQPPSVNQSIAEFAERTGKIRAERSARFSRSKPYDMSVGTIRKSHVNKDTPNQVPNTRIKRVSGTAPESDQNLIRTETRRRVPPMSKEKQLNTPTPPPQRTTTDDRPSTSAEAGLTQRVSGSGQSSNGKRSPKKRSPKQIEKWLAFKAKKKAIRITALRSVPHLHPTGPPQQKTPIEMPPEVTRSSILSSGGMTAMSPPQLQIDESRSSPTLSEIAGKILGEPPGAFMVSTTNGSTITFGDFPSVDIDQIDIDDLMN